MLPRRRPRRPAIHRTLACAFLIACAALTSLANEPGALRWFSPASGETGAGPRTTLSWSIDEGRPVPQGGFESGLTGWEIRAQPADRPAQVVTNRGSASAPVPAFEGTRMLRITAGEAALHVTLPALGTDRALGLAYVEGGGLGLSTGLEFVPDDPALPRTVLLQAVGGLVGLPASTATWRRRGVDLTPLAGQPGTLVWLFPNADLIPWFLDDVRWIGVPQGVRFQVWMTRDSPSLGAADTLLGLTDRPAWPLRELAPSTTYRWRVDVVRDSGPWKGPESSFRTATAGVESIPWIEGDTLAGCPGAVTAFNFQLRDERGFPHRFGPRSLEAQAVIPASRPPSVRITEVDPRATDGVECRNLSDQPMDLSGWRLELFQRNDRNQPSVSLTLPAGSSLAPGAHFVAQENRPPASRWPLLRLPSLDWMDQGQQPLGVLLRDASGEVVDAFFADPSATQASEAAPGLQSIAVDAGQWLGRPVTNRPSGLLTFQRRGDRDTNTRRDWDLAAASMNAANPGLTVPALPGATAIAVPWVSPRELSSDPQDPGAWFGLAVATPTADFQWFVHIRAPGHADEFLLTPPLRVPRSPCLELVVPEVLKEGGPSPAPLARLRLSSPVDQDTEVQLAFSWPQTRTAQVPVLGPSRVVVPAGASEVTFTLDLPDDDRLTGPRTALLRAFVDGGAPTLAALALEDNETARLFLEIPSTVQEGRSVTALLRLDRAVSEPVEVPLATSRPDLVRIPRSVHLEAGEQEARFQVTGMDEPFLLGSAPVRLTADLPGWTPAFADLERTDNDQAILRLEAIFSTTLPEGSSLPFRLTLGGLLDHALPVMLTARPESGARIPARVEVPAGTNAVEFTIEVPDDTRTNGLRTLVIAAEAAGFLSADLSLTVQDNDPARLRIDLLPSPFNPGVSFPATVSLETLDGRLVSGIPWDTPTLQLLGPDGTRFEIESGEFVSDLYVANGRVLGTGDRLRLEARSGALTGVSLPFSVWNPAPNPDNIGWAYFDAPRDQFVVIPGFPGSLWEFISASDGRITPLLPSPIGTGRIVPTSDGDHLGILHRAGESLQSLDLRSRTPSFDIPLGSAFPGHRRAALDLASVPGLSNALVVARFDGTNLNRGGDLSLFRDGQRLEPSWPLPDLAVLSSLAGDGALADVSLLTEGHVLFHPVGPEGVGAPHGAPLASPCSVELTARPFPQLPLLQYAGVLLLPCLDRVDTRLPGFLTHRERRISEAPRALDPVSGRIAMLSQNSARQWRFELFAPHAAQRIWVQEPAFGLGQPSWLAPAGPDRWIVIDGGQLRLFSTPDLSSGPGADLSVTVEVLRLEGDQGAADLRVRIENHGPATAPSVALEFSRETRLPPESRTLGAPARRMEATELAEDLHTVGDLAPGDAVDVPLSFRSVDPAFLRRLVGAALVSSHAVDPIPANNRAEYRIDALSPGPVPRLAISRTEVPGATAGSPRVVLSFPSVANHRYQLETQDDFNRRWIAEEDALLGNGSPLEIRLPITARDLPKLWRLRRDWPTP